MPCSNEPGKRSNASPSTRTESARLSQPRSYYFTYKGPPDEKTSLSYLGVGAVIAVAWTIALQAAGGYEIRHLATGPEEVKRVLRASALTASVLAIACYA